MVRRKTFEVQVTCPVHEWHTGLSIRKSIQFCEEVRNRKETQAKHRLLYAFCVNVFDSIRTCSGELVSTSYFIGAVTIEAKFSSLQDAQEYIQTIEGYCLSNPVLNNLLLRNHIRIEAV